MNILKLAAMLTLDWTRFKAGLKEAESASAKTGANIGSAIKGQFAAAFGAGAIIAFAKESVTFLGGLKDIAEQSHMTTDEVQLLTAATEHMGLTFGDAAAAERQFNNHRKEAVEKNQELRDTFAKYGVTLEDLQNPQFKFFDFLRKANMAMKDFDETQMQRGLNDMAEMLGTKVGPRLQELIKQLDSVNGMKLFSKEVIEETDRKLDKWNDMIRTMKGNFAEGIQTMPTPSNIGKWMGFKGIPNMSPFAVAIGSAGGVPTTTTTKTPDPLFEQTIEKAAAKKRKEEFYKARAELEGALIGFGLSKQDALEERMRQAMDFIGEAEDGGGMTTASAGARKDLIALLAQSKNEAFKTPGVSGLESMGGLGGGRQFVNTGDKEIVKAARELLKPAQETAENTRKLKDIKPGGTIKVRL